MPGDLSAIVEAIDGELSCFEHRAYRCAFGEGRTKMKLGISFRSVRSESKRTGMLDSHQTLFTLLELTQALTEDRPVEELLKKVAEAGLALIGATHASVRLLDASRTELLSSARAGDGSDAPLPFRRGEGLVGWVALHGQPVRLEDATRDPRFVPQPQQDFAIRAFLAEPLWSSGEVIGVLSLSSAEVGVFSEDDQLLARLLANCSVPAIERARLRALASFDDLTLAYNHRLLEPRLAEEMARARRQKTPLAMLLLDLDHFKKVNDEHGHGVGDKVLRVFAQRVRAQIRRVDVFIRRGGEEFIVLMPAASLEQGQGAALRLQKTMEEAPVEIDDIRLTQTVSIGVAAWDGQEAGDAFERRADLAMYEAKRLGRNRVVLAP